MPDTKTIDRLRGLALSPDEIKKMNPNWPDAMIEDYLAILDSLEIIATLLDVEIDQKIEEISTDFLDGSVPFVEDGKLIEDNSHFFWDLVNKILKITGIVQSEGRIKGKVRLTFADSPYSINIADELIFADTDDGPITLNLPSGTDGEPHSIKNTGSSHNDVTLSPSGAELLNGVNESEIIKDSEAFDIGYDSIEGWWV